MLGEIRPCITHFHELKDRSGGVIDRVDSRRLTPVPLSTTNGVEGSMDNSTVQ
jgi:hypothetical protein